MDIAITPKELFGTAHIIESKSHAHRILICAALSDRPTKIICTEISEDIEATARCLCSLGAKIERTADGFFVSPTENVPDLCEMDCGESGSTLRFLLPVVGALGANARIKMSGRLPARPLSPLWEELCAHGMILSKPCEDIIECKGRLCAGNYTLPGNISSQYISGLLFALPLLEGDSRLVITGKTESRAYIDMTLKALADFGISPAAVCDGFEVSGRRVPRCRTESFRAEGDWSNAAFWLCAGAVCSGEVTCAGLDTASIQGDRRVTEILVRFGAQVTVGGDAVTVRGGDLRGCVIDAADIPDLVPILSVVACKAQGETRIINAERLRIKESDRLKTVSETLSALGADIAETDDGLVIRGGTALHGGTVSSAGDHRIAMSAAIASCMCSGTVTVTDAQAVNKSYPKFWQHFEALGGKIEVI